MRYLSMIGFLSLLYAYESKSMELDYESSQSVSKKFFSEKGEIEDLTKINEDDFIKDMEKYVNQMASDQDNIFPGHMTTHISNLSYLNAIEVQTDPLNSIKIILKDKNKLKDYLFQVHNQIQENLEVGDINE